MQPSPTATPLPELTLTATPLDLPLDSAMLALTLLAPLSHNQRGVIDAMVAMLEDELLLDVAPGPSIDSGYCWLLQAGLVEQYAAGFKSYFDFIGVHCEVVIAPSLRTPLPLAG